MLHLFFVSKNAIFIGKPKLFGSGELLNFGLLFVQFFATDVFLNGKWRYYGLKVIEYYSFTFEQRNDPDLLLKYG